MHRIAWLDMGLQRRCLPSKVDLRYVCCRNGFFALTIHAIPAAWRYGGALRFEALTAAHYKDCKGCCNASREALVPGCRRCSLITSSFHMPRSRAIFETCFALAGASLYCSADRFSLDFHAVHDVGVFPTDVLEARKQREAHSLLVRLQLHQRSAVRTVCCASCCASFCV